MELEPIQIYTIVEAKSVNELVKLANMKTKAGWICLGGICFTPGNYCEADSQSYPFCQSMYRMEKPRREKPAAKEFVAFPYEDKKHITPQDLPPITQKTDIIKKTTPFNKKKKHYAQKHSNKNK